MAEGAALEKRYTSGYHGFKSHPLRQCLSQSEMGDIMEHTQTFSVRIATNVSPSEYPPRYSAELLCSNASSVN